MKQKRMDNKGFTLVELIIVMAIMAVLLGIVGTQVIPYLERSREAKDLQIVNSFCTAAVSAYSMNAENENVDDLDQILVSDSGYTPAAANTGVGIFSQTISELTGYDSLDDIEWYSKKGGQITTITIDFDFAGGEITATANGFEANPVVAKIGEVDTTP